MLFYYDILINVSVIVLCVTNSDPVANIWMNQLQTDAHELEQIVNTYS